MPVMRMPMRLPATTKCILLLLTVYHGHHPPARAYKGMATRGEVGRNDERENL